MSAETTFNISLAKICFLIYQKTGHIKSNNYSFVSSRPSIVKGL